jgi:hypothetical protein
VVLIRAHLGVFNDPLEASPLFRIPRRANGSIDFDISIYHLRTRYGPQWGWPSERIAQAETELLQKIASGIFEADTALNESKLDRSFNESGGSPSVGLVGNTGNSTEPRLHFHIADATSPLGAEGLAYALSSFELQGHADDTKVVAKEKSQTQMLALPLEGEVVKFVTTP